MFKNNVFLAVFTFFSLRFCDTTSSDCTQLTPCSCIFPDGQGFSLTNLVNRGILESSDTENCNYTFYFQPCQNAKISREGHKCNNNSDVSVCAWNSNTKSFFNLGAVEETSVVFLPSGSLSLHLKHMETTTSIKLLCCDNCNTKFTIDSCPANNHYNLMLVSPEACKKRLVSRGLSTGSILVILFFVFSGVYFIGGALALKFLRGATGWEMLPNHEFWCDLPSLVRDGIVFAFNCCKADSYQRI